MKYIYPAEKFADARRYLMLPHPSGEAQSIASAFHECHLGLMELDDSHFDEHSLPWVRKLRALMDTTNLKDDAGEGLWTVKARSLSIDEKSELSTIIDELASWFRRNRDK